MTSRALRIGVLLGGNLVEEKLFHARSGPITFGQSLHCTLSIPGDGIPREHVLVAFDQGRPILRASSAMTGRIADGDTLVDVRPGDIPVPPGARGKLVIGDATILFQDLAAAPPAPRPVLPASVRGTLADRVDRRLAAIVGASLVAHLGIAAYAWVTDVESPSMLETPVATTYRHETIEVSLPDAPVLAPTVEPGIAAPVAPVQTPAPIVNRPRIAPSAPTTMTVEDAQRFASILTGSETGRTGVGSMRDRTPGAELGQQIDDVGDRPVTVGTTDTGFREHPGPQLGTDTGPRIVDPTQGTRTPPKVEADRGGRIHVKPLRVEDDERSTLTVAMVLDKINTVYMFGLKRCYQKGLVGDLSLAGKITVAFTVSPRGSLEAVTARGVSTEVDACVDTFMGTWRFPVPKDEDGDPTEQSFKLSLQLTPS